MDKTPYIMYISIHKTNATILTSGHKGQRGFSKVSNDDNNSWHANERRMWYEYTSLAVYKRKLNGCEYASL